MKSEKIITRTLTYFDLISDLVIMKETIYLTEVVFMVMEVSREMQSMHVYMYYMFTERPGMSCDSFP